MHAKCIEAALVTLEHEELTQAAGCTKAMMLIVIKEMEHVAERTERPYLTKTDQLLPGHT